MVNLPEITIRDLAGSGVHFGHKVSRWNAKMAPYIYGIHQENRIHIIDLRKTLPLLQVAMRALYDVASQGGRVLFVGTKFQALDIIASEAIRCGQYYVNYRWLGGMLTNWETVSSSIKTLIQCEKILNNGNRILTKKELGNIEKKRQKLDKALGGIREMGAIPDILFVIDTNKEHIAVKEAKKLRIPIAAVLDTNSSPDDITYPIPGNDDSRKSVELYCRLAADCILSGIESSLAKSGVKVGNVKGSEFIQEKGNSVVEVKKGYSKVHRKEVIVNENESR
ncbi:30S ribosomal protein S2 [Wolbachia endosymbiont of Dirofilaria (Dirofilaria) immitis]|uniref:30S ribosomal protein S2 n=1 Tax=Wolbachia endosymbiont of Dirofilaria (Dirofilaria) immitis TaxID=1812115 RepID=UPI00158E5575|nr:30S ribosomal protein S2 [Wolbachia endosymbiont of Dirofilaria (Dirofilaria) immitis]QKX02624.1 30S ribosomal protein S2 [Wolbachia endosymbiont of Dirofilaria (Dirofilaria) immitis]